MQASTQGEHADERQTVFIATTSEAMNADWLREAIATANRKIQAEHDGIELQPWTSAFESGDITSLRLIELAAEPLGAVVVLTADDFITSREEESLAPRDNVLLEAGLFLGRLGLRQVLLVRESGSKWPSDLLGVTAKEFSRPGGSQPGASTIVSDEIAMLIEKFVRRLAPFTTAAGRALRHSSVRVMEQAEKFRADLGAEPGSMALTVPDPAAAYLEAVNEVQENFATTTYLDSEFWTSSDIGAVAANQEMLRRIRKANGTARRLIVLPNPISEELETQRNLRRLLRSGDPNRVEQMNLEYRRLAEANLELITQGFEVRVVCDQYQAYRRLPKALSFEEGSTEFAIYDDSRLDVFTGFTSKNQSQVQTYFTDSFIQFDVLLEKVQTYFNTLWDSPAAEDFSQFGDQMDALIEEIDQEIDYTSNWLTLYDKTAGEDGELKEAESSFVLTCLAKRYPADGEKAASHIDLGTCTGRYLNELADSVRADGKIVGVDNDPDCIALLKLKKLRGELDSRADVVYADIRRRDQLPTQKFAIVTCMMGTLCHLVRIAANHADHYDDPWQAGIDNLAGLLTEDGDAFIAVWHEQMCEDKPRGSRKLLEIYAPLSKDVLCQHSPGLEELKKRASQAGLEVVQASLVKRRLRVLHLRRAT
jgi:SAM-dependent methyltransferase